MSKLRNLLNNMRFKHLSSLDLQDKLQIGYYKKFKGGKALLCNGKILKKSIDWASYSLLEKDTKPLINYLCVKTTNGKLFLYNQNGKCLTLNGLPIYEPDTVLVNGIYATTIKDNKEEIIVRNLPHKKQIIINLHDQSISPEYIFIDSTNPKNERKIKYDCGLYYYIDENYSVISEPFIDETSPDKNGNKIRTIFSSTSNHTQALYNTNNKRISNCYNQIELESDGSYKAFLSEDNIYTYLNFKGKKIYETSSPLSEKAREKLVKDNNTEPNM